MTDEKKKKQHVKGHSFKSNKVASYTRKQTVKSYERTVTVKPKTAKTESKKSASKKAKPRKAKRGTKQTMLRI